MYTDIELKELRTKLTHLEEFQQIEIFKIISNNDVKYTKNNNGIFLNMKLINDNCLKEILDYLVFIKNNKIL
tara:strand:- start:2230 stop:2445 length:216 start_codon:yes stop_codon:yes gene_type:complete